MGRSLAAAGITHRMCVECETILPIEAFHSPRGRSVGTRCYSCYKRRRGAASNRSHQKYPEKKRARLAVAKAIKDGRLPKASDCKCVDCGAPAWCYDHHRGHSFKFWLDVQAICRACDGLRRRARRAAERRLQRPLF